MAYIQGEDRKQITLFANCIEDYVENDNPVRGIEAFVESLDINVMGFKKANPAEVGRPPYDPRDLLKLYIYGYLNRIRSSRRLETETGRNIELMWLMRKLTPDFKTIADFRRDNSDALKSVFRQFNILCKGWGLFGETIIAIDGTKIRANNSKKKNYSRKKVKRQITYIDQRIEEYLEQLDQADKDEAEIQVPTAQEIHQRIAKLKERKQDYQNLLEEMQNQGINEVSLTDPDARMMAVNNNGVDVCYNVQIAVDSLHSLVVDCDVINNPTDHGQLSEMGKRSKEVLEVEELDVLGDKGYYSAKDLITCEEEKLTTYVAKQKYAANIKDPEFYNSEFKYDAKENVYICPAGQKLYPGRIRKTGNTEGQDYKNYRACKNCQYKDRCTKSKKGRAIFRNIHQEFLDQVDKRTQENKVLYQRRQLIVEHPFGTVKRQWGFNYFLTRGLKSVKTEASLAFLAYNFRRVISILGVEGIRTRLCTA